MLAFILGVWVYATQLVAGLVVVRALAYEGSASGRVARALLLGPAAITVQCLLYDLLSLPFTLLLVLLPWWIAAAVVVARAGFVELLRRETRIERSVFGFFGVVFALNLAFGLCRPVIDTDAVVNFALFGRDLRGTRQPRSRRAESPREHRSRGVPAAHCDQRGARVPRCGP